ncbi:MAG: hypothetical protein ABIM42_00905 [candidate division WOR-3 bacterium]
MILSILIAYIFSSRDYTCINNAFEYIKQGDTVWVATSGGVVKFHKDDFTLAEDSASLLFSVYSSSSGLRGNKVRSITLDDKGNIWVLVQDMGIHVKPYGENRFLYYSLPLLTLNRSKIVRFYPPDYLLLGTDYGLFVVKTGGNLDPSDDRIYPPLRIRDTVLYIFSDTNIVYVSTFSNIYIWSEDSVSVLELPINTRNFGPICKFGNKILYSTGDKLVFWSPDTVKAFDLNKVWHISNLQDSFYVASVNGVYKVFNGILTRVSSRNTALAIPLGEAILATFYAINREYAGYGPPWNIISGNRTYTLKIGSPFNVITSMDYKKGILACATLMWTSDTISLRSKGFVFKDNFYLLDSLKTINHAVRSIAIDDSLKIWVGTYSTNALGIYVFDSTGKFLHKIEGLPSPIVTHIAIGWDTVVALWQQGIYRIRRENDTYHVKEVFRVDYPFVITHGSMGFYIIGTENEGLIKIDTAGNVILRISPADLNSALVSMAKEKGGNIYIGTSSGFLKYSNGTVKRLVDGYVRDFEFYNDYIIVLQDSALLILRGDSVQLKLTPENSCKTFITQPFYMVRDVLEVTENGDIIVGGEEGFSILKVLYPKGFRGYTRIFPNPCKRGEKLYIESEVEPKVFDLGFRKLEFKPVKDGDIYYFRTDDWEPGVYIIVVEGSSASTVIIKK